MKSIKYILIFFSLLYSQSKIIDLPAEFIVNEFYPSKISVSNTGIYLLDTDSRRVAFLASDNKIIYSGGYGNEFDSFIDPIDILTFKLGVWIVDGTENKLISFDSKLNYLQDVEFDEIYPELCNVDDWGNILLYSQLTDKIYKVNNIDYELNEFIDLSIYSDISSSITDIVVTEDGSIGLLSTESIYIFNRLGRVISILNVANNYQFIYKYNLNWFAIDSNNKIINLKGGSVNFSINEPILDIYQKGKHIYFLLPDKIRVVNAFVE